MRTSETGFRWKIRKGRPSDSTTNPSRPWQLWLIAGDVMGLKAERSRQDFCVQVMQRLEEANSVTRPDSEA